MRARSPITSAVIEAVVERRRASERDYQIARDLGVDGTALSRRLSELGLGQHQVGLTKRAVVAKPVKAPKPPRPAKPPAPAKVAKPKPVARVLQLEARHLDQIRRLAPDLTASEIADWLEISREDVRLVSTRNGIELMVRHMKQRAEA